MARHFASQAAPNATGFDFLGGAVLDSDLNAGLAAELPAAVHAALQGRSRPILRLVELDRETSVTSTEDLSMGLLAATVCDDGPFPWQPETPISERQALLAAARNALAPGATGPFGKWCPVRRDLAVRPVTAPQAIHRALRRHLQSRRQQLRARRCGPRLVSRSQFRH